MFPVLQLVPLVKQTASLIVLVSFAIGSSLAERQARRRGVHAAAVSNGILLALFAGLSGARLVYAARYLDTYLANPAGIIPPNPNALAVPEGLVIAGLAALFYWWVKDQPLRRLLDAITPLLAVLAIGLGVAHLAAGTAYGAPTQIPWAVYLWDDYRHPTQIYEILAAILLFLTLYWALAGRPFPGFRFLLWLALSAAARLILEAFRGDNTLILGGLRAAQLESVAGVLLGLWLMGRWVREANARPESNAQVADQQFTFWQLRRACGGQLGKSGLRNDQVLTARFKCRMGNGRPSPSVGDRSTTENPTAS